MKTSFRFLPLCALGLALGTACKKETPQPVDTTPVTTATPVATLDVGDLDMGRHVGPDKKISDKTDDFAPKDTIYASVHTKGGSGSPQLTARWTFEDSTVVNESTQAVTAGGDTDTEFHIVKAGGWPKGKYTLHLLLDGKEIKTKDVTVK